MFTITINCSCGETHVEHFLRNRESITNLIAYTLSVINDGIDEFTVTYDGRDVTAKLLTSIIMAEGIR